MDWISPTTGSLPEPGVAEGSGAPGNVDSEEAGNDEAGNDEAGNDEASGVEAVGTGVRVASAIGLVSAAGAVPAS